MMGNWINENLSGPLAAFFHPTNVALNAVDNPLFAKICAIGLFLAAMIWVYTLKKEYVNMDAPMKNALCDLRIWTVVSMLPHILIYLWIGT